MTRAVSIKIESGFLQVDLHLMLYRVQALFNLGVRFIYALLLRKIQIKVHTFTFQIGINQDLQIQVRCWLHLQ